MELYSFPRLESRRSQNIKIRTYALWHRSMEKDNGITLFTRKEHRINLYVDTETYRTVIFGGLHGSKSRFRENLFR